jgi:hypothetical protein
MTASNIAKLRKELTSFERFDMMRQMPSDTLHARIYERCQAFLDSFVRQNVMDFAALPVAHHLVPVTLDAVHQVIYTELSHRLSSQSMTIRHAKKSKATGQTRFRDAIAELSTAEEALSRRAASIDREALHAGDLAQLITFCESEVKALKSELKAAISSTWVRGTKDMDALADQLLENKALGDDETITFAADLVAAARKTLAGKGGKESSNDERADTEDEDIEADSDRAKEKPASK